MKNETGSDFAPTLRETLAELVRLAIWTQDCIPETLAMHYGDVEPTIRHAQQLLAEMEGQHA